MQRLTPNGVPSFAASLTLTDQIGQAPGAIAVAPSATPLPLTAQVGALLGFTPLSGPSAEWSLPLPANPALVGLVLRAQGAGLDAALPLALSNGLDLYLGL